MSVVPVEGIEPPLLAERDFEFARVYQFRHTGLERLLYRQRLPSAKENRDAAAVAREAKRWICTSLATAIKIGKLLRNREAAAARSG